MTSNSERMVGDGSLSPESDVEMENAMPGSSALPFRDDSTESDDEIDEDADPPSPQLPTSPPDDTMPSLTEADYETFYWMQNPRKAHLISQVTHKPPRRKYYEFPLIRPIDHLKQYAGLEYEYYRERPKGYRTPEKLFKWSLYKDDWFYMETAPRVVMLVSRSILLAMGIEEDELPPLPAPGPELGIFSAGFPERPVRWEDLHSYDGHGPGSCYWPKMTADPEFVPVLDRSFSKHRKLDSIMVQDPDNATELTPGPGHPFSEFENLFSIRYVSMDPKLVGIPWVPRPPQEVQLSGRLHLSRDAMLGKGNNASAYDAKLTLPYILAHQFFSKCYAADDDASDDDTSALEVDSQQEYRRNDIPLQFRVAAKLAGDSHEAREMLLSEVKLYDAFPKYLQENWSGYHLIPPIKLPQPAAAVVAKNYGYYVPDVRYGKLSNGQSIGLQPAGDLNGILLLENCGEQLKNPGQMHVEYREQVYSMMERLQLAGFTQGSVYERNILVQPGPLTILPEERTLENPSFRIIDFGRGISIDDTKQQFRTDANYDKNKAGRLLKYVHFEEFRE